MRTGTGKVLVSHRGADICWGRRAEEQPQPSCASFCIPPLPGTRPISACWPEWVVKSRKTYVVVLNPAQDRRGRRRSKVSSEFGFLGFSTGTVSLLFFKRGLPAGQTSSMPPFFSRVINFAESACLRIVPGGRGSNSVFW